jgi:hypothetical protein
MKDKKKPEKKTNREKHLRTSNEKSEKGSTVGSRNNGPRGENTKGT